MSVMEFRGPGLSESQWQQIRALATTLDSRQLQWLSGFFAGVDFRTGDLTQAPLLPAESPSAPARQVTILYGSETGNAAALAAGLAAQAEARGLSPRLSDMADYKLRGLKDEQDLVLVTSTYGDGDPPQPAANFFEFVESRKAPKLQGLRFAVLALGDSTYERYCEAGKRLDRRLEELGAARLLPRVDCDIDYEEAAAGWTADLLGLVTGPAAPTQVSPAPGQADAGTPRFDKRHPFPARIIDNLVLSGRGSSKETRHVEISLEGSGLTHEPGDSLGVMPANDPALVEALAGELGFDGTAAVTVKDTPFPVSDAFARHFEITALTPRFIEHWAGVTGAEALKRLCEPACVDERAAFMRGHHIIDVVRRFPAKGLDPQTLLAGLRPLQPRLYSIASSWAAAPDEAHLTVSTLRYDLHGEPRAGVASGHLADRGQPDEPLPVYIHANPHFRLPADDVPIIMVGAGTGVAPYRAFMQEREVRGAAGRSWLVFGERNFRTDFLYQSEWLALLAAGTLTRMDVAFSRDGRREGHDKVYVQHRLKEQARDVFAWLEEGACFYVCGDASRLAPDVHEALRSIIASQGGLGADATEDYLQRLQREHRYQRDVY